jgi:hypothetical protein
MLLPPVDAVYHTIVFPVEVPVKLIEEPLQILVPVLGVTGVGAEGGAMIVSVTEFEVTGHVPLLIIQVKLPAIAAAGLVMVKVAVVAPL